MTISAVLSLTFQNVSIIQWISQSIHYNFWKTPFKIALQKMGNWYCGIITDEDGPELRTAWREMTLTLINILTFDSSYSVAHLLIKNFTYFWCDLIANIHYHMCHMCITCVNVIHMCGVLVHNTCKPYICNTCVK